MLHSKITKQNDSQNIFDLILDDGKKFKKKIREINKKYLEILKFNKINKGKEVKKIELFIKFAQGFLKTNNVIDDDFRITVLKEYYLFLKRDSLDLESLTNFIEKYLINEKNNIEKNIEILGIFYLVYDTKLDKILIFFEADKKYLDFFKSKFIKKKQNLFKEYENIPGFENLVLVLDNLDTINNFFIKNKDKFILSEDQLPKQNDEIETHELILENIYKEIKNI